MSNLQNKPEKLVFSYSVGLTILQA